METELESELSSRVLWGHPGTDAGGSRGSARSGRRSQARRYDGLRRLVASSALSSAACLALIDPGCWGRRRGCWSGARPFDPRPVPHVNQECGDVLAVLAGLFEGGAGAARGYPFAPHSNANIIVGRVRPANDALCLGVFEFDFFDDLAFLVVEAS